MRRGGSTAHGEGGVEQKHTLTCPMLEIAVHREGTPEVVVQLLVHVAQRRRYGDTTTHGETQTVGLARAVIRILAEDDHLGVGVRREVQRGEDVVVRREHRAPVTFLTDEVLQGSPVRLFELVTQHGVPISRRHALHCCHSRCHGRGRMSPRDRRTRRSRRHCPCRPRCRTRA